MKNLGFAYFKILTITIILLFSSFKAQQEVLPEQVGWNTHYLAKPDANYAFAALTVTNWQYSYTATVTGRNLHIDFKFSAGVVPEKSWVKRDRIGNRKSSRVLLNHEQGHVYINFLLLKESEIVIRDQKYTIANYKRSIQAVANKVSKYYSDMQERYDTETKHGANDEAQAKWDEFLREEMNKYE